MGCFLSTTTTKTNKQPPTPTPQPKHNDPTATPSEEEKTKQETPQILFKNNTSHDATVKKPTEEHVTEQVSDMCSYTDSFFSVATTTTTVTTDSKVNVAKTEDEDGEVTQKLNTCPPTKRIPKKPPNKLSDKKELLPLNRFQTRQHNRNVVRRDHPARKPRSSGGLGKCRNVTLKHNEEMNVKLGGNKGKVKVVKIGDGGVSVPRVLVPEPDPEISLKKRNDDKFMLVGVPIRSELRVFKSNQGVVLLGVAL